MDKFSVKVDAEPFEMVPHWILFNTQLSANAILIWLILRKHRNWETGQCWPSRERIASLCGVSSRTVDRELPSLAAVGAITITKRKNEKGGDDSNLYTLHWEPFGVVHKGGDNLSQGGRQKVAKGGDRKSHELIPINNKEGIPEVLSRMEDGPEFDAAFLAYAKGQLE